MSVVNERLGHIFRELEPEEFSGDMETVISGIEIDSRKIKPGDLYLCIPGFKVDGHDFAQNAVKAGAAALVVERFLPLGVPQVRVRDVREAAGRVAAQIYGNPAQKLELVGVTGTNGKTTITHLIEKIAVHLGKKVGLIGTLGARIDGRAIPGERTTPEAIEVQKLLAEMVQAQVELAVMEVSSHALTLGRVNGCEFDAGIFSNLTQDHLDYHQTMAEYLQAKAELFRGLHGPKQPKLALINADDPAFAELKKVSAAPVISYGIRREADYQAKNVQVSARGVNFVIKFRNQSQEVTYATPGEFSVYNALAAFAWGVERGYEPEQVAEALAQLPGVAGRFESIRAGQPFQVIVDYAHTPDGLENVLRTAREFTSGKLITVFGCGGDRDKGKRPVMGQVAAKWSDYVLVTSDNPRTEEPDQIIREVLAGVSGVEHSSMRDRREGIRSACRLAEPGDTVLIAGKGHETYQIIGTEVHEFDDREEARSALRGLGYVCVD